MKNIKSIQDVINRRETEPLLKKAFEMAKAYKRAVNADCSVLGKDGHCVGSPDGLGNMFCSLCKKYSDSQEQDNDPSRFPCTDVHLDAVKESQRFGGIYIYMCERGFIYWTSPIFSYGHLVGSFICATVGIDREEAIESIQSMSRGEITYEEAKELLSQVSDATPERVQAMAQILLICAEHLSKGTDDYFETLKRRTEQQSQLSSEIHHLKDQQAAGMVMPGYPLDKERMLMAALRRGDNDTGRKILNELLGNLFFSNPDNFKYMQFRAIELVVLLSRAAFDPSTTEDSVLETNNRYLRRIQEAQNVEELTDILHIIVDRMASQIFSFRGARHAAALRRAERYIWENFSRKISLPEIAAASGLSAPYFSTIFKEEMGENLSSYLNRLRVEKASHLLTETMLSLSEIAGICGFEDQSWFSKIFKQYMGVSPGKYREYGGGLVPEVSEIHNTPS
ncbi:helix-turn-helix domain-containing protein [Breznakiella homolactica]|uniref:Helix-turn-helix domain-containing protein n=1 Tax=Breznakiella homolactica TaxID=2798577 RepID=A0A7T7XQ99_9SPIR|nr:helix-turn-helix domain-containing protein [Breznakiella homolactica]QQO10496.1 helix-turn-helix domain-containing protein [Breznakiella homolactica]